MMAWSVVIIFVKLYLFVQIKKMINDIYDTFNMSYEVFIVAVSHGY